MHLVHRLVAIAFIPNPENKSQINHKDGNKKNNTISNLEWVTPRENIVHSYEMGMSPVGSLSVRSKLTEKQVKKIKEMISKRVKQKDIAKTFNVDVCTICDIKKGRSWRHVS